MSDVARIAIRPPELDEPARRLLWIIPAAIAIWAILLSVFSLILMRTAVVPQEEQKPIEARLVEIPPVIGGLQGNPAAPAIPHPKAAPVVKPHPAAHVKKAAPLPPVIRSPYGTEKTTEAPSVEENPGASSGAPESGESDEEEGGGSGAESAPTRLARARFTRRRR